MDNSQKRNGGGRRDSRTRILTVTGDLLRTRGLAGLTIDDVACAAGVARRTVYNHFASTTDLFVTSRKLLIEDLKPLIPASIARKVPCEIALREFASGVLSLLTDARHLDLYFSLVRDGADHPSLMHAYERAVLVPVREQLASFFASRAWPTLHDPEVAALEIVAALAGIALATRLFGASTRWTDAALSAIVTAFLTAHRPALSVAA